MTISILSSHGNLEMCDITETNLFVSRIETGYLATTRYTVFVHMQSHNMNLIKGVILLLSEDKNCLHTSWMCIYYLYVSTLTWICSDSPGLNGFGLMGVVFICLVQ